MRILRTAILSVGLMAFAACGGSDKPAETTPATTTEPVEATDDMGTDMPADDMGAENPCAAPADDMGAENPCAPAEEGAEGEATEGGEGDW